MQKLLSLSLGEIFGCVAGFILFLSIFIEITPIKINPISKFLSWFGRKTNAEIEKKVDILEKKVDKVEEMVIRVQEEAEERNAINCRVRILRFGDEIRNKREISKEYFDQVLADIDGYEKYCQSHPNFKNSKADRTIKMITNEYDKHIQPKEE